MSQREKSVVPGILLIGIGVLFLLNQLDVIYLRWRHIYPLLFLGLGGWFFMKVFARKERGAAFVGTMFLVLGLFFALRNYRVLGFDDYFYDFESFWPIFLIACGLGFVVLFLFRPEDWGVLIPGGILLLFGVAFFLEMSGFVYWRRIMDFWPVILIAVGAGIVLSGLRRRSQ
ncbi:MAG: hypothetical protein D6743_05465 [Calditrichaeota bacterium]|nr:MAG: hypothetical protein D6743_05465 [Calditrichota bacterium]